MMKLTSLACVCALVFGVVAHARSFTPEEKRADFEQLASMIKTHYGPYDYKRTKLKLDVDMLVEEYSTKAEKVSNLEFYHLINRFVAEFQDSHFGTSAQVNYLATLGFVADRIGGAVLLDVINRSMLPETRFPFQRGDEIVDIDGKPAADIVKDLAKYMGAGYEETALRKAAVFIGYRPATTLPPMTGVSKVSVRRGTSSIVETVTLPWFEIGDLDDEDEKPTWASKGPADYAEIDIKDFVADMPKGEQLFRCQGITRTAVPKGTTVLMSTPFVAYYHPTPKGNVGYLRIPHYSWDKDSDLRFQQYEWVIEQLEKNTVGLIIDQDHNCGGSVFFLEKMVGLFTNKPFKGLEFQFLASRAEYLDFKTWVDTDARRTLQGSDWLGVVDLVTKAWKGTSRMTAKTSFHHNRMQQPNAVHYTKPIVMLIDEMSGSGGDAFPAMMQGLGRAKLMGQRTMGAGGHVVAMPNLNNSANMIRLTKSLFYRPDGVEVENNGAVPDITYQPTRDDFLYEYRNYQKAYLAELAKLIP